MGLATELVIWIAAYLVETLFLAWIALGSGASRLEGTWLAELVAYRGIMTSRGGLEAIAWLCWIGSTIYFILGLIVPEFRWL